MILVGQYDSPYVRRVAVSLRVLGFAYEHDTRSIFADFDAMRRGNPLGRIPALVLDDGEVLIDSAAILDWLDGTVCPERALIPPSGPERRRALRIIALATGAIDKVGAAAYERLLRPPALRWPEWIERCRTQGAGAIAALAAEPWPGRARLDQAAITTACTIRYVRMADPTSCRPAVFRRSTPSPSAAKTSPPSRPPGPPSTCCPVAGRSSPAVYTFGCSAASNTLTSGEPRGSKPQIVLSFKDDQTGLLVQGFRCGFVLCHLRADAIRR